MWKATDLDASSETEEVDGEAHNRRSLEDSEVVTRNINTFLKRVVGFSVAEIDRQITELHSLRQALESEGTRVQREFAEFFRLSQLAIQSTGVLTQKLSRAKFESTVSSLNLGHDPRSRS